MPTKFRTNWLGHVLADAVERGLVTPKQIAEALHRDDPYTLLSGKHDVAADQVQFAYANLPPAVVDMLDAYLESHRPARGVADDDVNRDGRADQEDVAALLLELGKLDLNTMGELRGLCADGHFGADDARAMLLKVNALLAPLQGAQRILSRMGLAYPRRSA